MHIILPLPNVKLNPNRSKGKHWATSLKAKNEDKKIGYYITLKFITNNIIIFTEKDRLMRNMKLFFGDNRRRDDDNILASFKAMQDGIFLALKLDDSQIDYTILDKTQKDKLNPRIELILSKL